ncbi:MAG: adenylate kinase [Gemmatimonadetes bacterium]|nr:adenylate kinase [Gemmatimonadota bacterium]
MNIAIIGLSGAGKGTHTARIAARRALRPIATGDVFRHNLDTHTTLGLLARRYMEDGDLVPDEVVHGMIEEWCARLAPGDGTLFDGFPRTVHQAEFLDELMFRHDRRLDGVIYLKVHDEEVVRRLAGRLLCHNCQASFHETFMPPSVPGRCDHCGSQLHRRPDDATEIVRARLRVFHRTTGPVLERYASAGRLVIVPGEGTVAEVGARLDAVVEALAGGTATFATAAEADEIAPESGPALDWSKFVRPSRDLVLLGGPGSGKGTQAKLLSADLMLTHIATGDLFRENLRQATPLGQLAKTYMDRGELVPDDVTEAMVEERIARRDALDGFILDGFPRTLPQARALTEMLGRLHRALAGVVCIKVSDEAIVSRLSGRLICRVCQAPYHTSFNPPRSAGRCDACGGELYQRDDDNANTVRARLATFHAQTEPLIAYYREAGLLHEIDGEGDVAAVGARALESVRQFT